MQCSQQVQSINLYFQIQNIFKRAMKVTLTDGNMMFHTIQVDNNESIQNIKALAEAQTNIPSEKIILMFEGKQLEDRQTLDQIGVKENDMLLIGMKKAAQIAQNNEGKPKLGIAAMIKKFDQGAKNSINQFSIPKRDFSEYRMQAERIKGQILYDHQRLAQIEKKDPELAKAIHSENIDDLANMLMKKVTYNLSQRDERIKKMIEEENKFRQLSKDPMNAEYQRMLEQRIHQQNIDKNMQFANQYIPEVFGRVNMLYINANINKFPIQAFVDSGAQSTIMSESLANRCGLMRLVDKRQSGLAVGVGSCKILGKIHAADIEIQGKFITCAFTVIQNNSVEFLLGLDMLKRFNCIIDLKKNSLTFDDGMIVTKFLGDGQIMKNKQGPQLPTDIQQRVTKLKNQGYPHLQVLEALRKTNYDVEMARTVLLQSKFGK